MTTARRPWGRIALAILFAILSANSLGQVLLVLAGRSNEPVSLTILQSAMALAGGAAAWGSWKGTRWAPLAAAGYGLVSAGMLVALPAILDLPRAESGGIWMGAAAIALFSVWATWYLRRAVTAPVA